MDNKKVMIGIEILKRTFEGKNDDPLTSNYSKSKKWLLRYKKPGYDHFVCELFATRKEAEEYLNLRLKYYDAIFEKVDQINDCHTPEELFEEYDDLIYYADGSVDSVLESIEKEGYNYSEFKYYLFNGWCIAIWK